MPSLYPRMRCGSRWFRTAPKAESRALTWPAGWVRCAWCKKVVPYGSEDLVQIKRRKGTMVMHKKCAHEAELHDWANAPPAHGGD